MTRAIWSLRKQIDMAAREHTCKEANAFVILSRDADTQMDALEFGMGPNATTGWLSGIQGPAQEKEKWERERKELRDLVGKNLHIMSQLEGVDLGKYRDTDLSRIVEQVVNFKDELAQCYLMDCIIQVFPNDFHLQTLGVLLGACPQLQPSVNIKMVLSGLMERLWNYAASSVERLEKHKWTCQPQDLQHSICFF
ncbi:unnamed protein product [Thlaspi arvense]|uniref:Uncharacterized protein n=1 Tax=Thlaspi arvense TaxID=13288 RepID=A0AAU9RS37_THLAR|nr:unnamed protein product [Thlaspi arvense]